MRLQTLTLCVGSEGSLDMRALDEELEDGETEKKELEPFDVPTGGTFWLHDDRMLDDGTQQRYNSNLENPRALK